MTHQSVIKLKQQLASLQERLAESEETLRAIRQGEVDAVIVQTPQGEQVFTLRGANHPYRVMVEEMAEGAVTFDKDGTILFCNQRFAELLHASLEEVIGTKLLKYLAAGDRNLFRKLLHGVNGAPARGEVNLLDGEGAVVPASVAVTAMALEQERTAFCMVVKDLTELRQLERQVLDISEREQQRLGQDLHDELVQALAGIVYMLESLECRQKRASDGRAKIKRIRMLLHRSIGQTRELAKGFYPVELERHGLKSALEELSDHIKETFHIRCDVKCDGSLSKIDKAAQIHLFRIAQEAVRNAVHHGHAGKILMRGARRGNEVTLTITNDGEVFSIDKLQKNLANARGMGLKIIHYRARMIGATLEINPAPGGGCVVKCSIPLPQNALA